MDKYSLGIDLGTTSVKVVIVHRISTKIILSFTEETKANVDVGDTKKSEQCVSKIFNVLNNLLDKIPTDIKEKVNYIGISGQMHGVVMWRKEPYKWDDKGKFHIIDDQSTHLITWQDQRCDRNYLNSLPHTGSIDKLNSGFGLPTLIWLQKNENDLFQKFDRCGTVQDLLVAILTQTTNHPIITDQNASSWGFYNADEKTWKTELLEILGFPTNILPEIKGSETQAGKLATSWSQIPSGCSVGAAVGDLETSVLSILHGKDDTESSAIINISTSIQITFLLPKDIHLHKIGDEHTKTVEYRPYFGGRFLAVGAGLNGGNYLAFVVSTLKSWMQKFGQSVNEEKIWETLLSEASNQKITDLVIEPTLLGERHCPEKSASIQNINQSNFGLGHIMRAACRGIIITLQELLPKNMLIKYGIRKIYATGSALIRNKALQEEIENIYEDFTIEVCNAGDAAFGAAIMGQI